MKNLYEPRYEQYSKPKVFKRHLLRSLEINYTYERYSMHFFYYLKINKSMLFTNYLKNYRYLHGTNHNMCVYLHDTIEERERLQSGTMRPRSAFNTWYLGNCCLRTHCQIHHDNRTRI